MEKTKHGLGEEHPDTLRSMANLAGTYRKLGSRADGRGQRHCRWWSWSKKKQR